MPQRVEKLAVLFADICGSTALYENLGDDLARKMISRCINIMSDKISLHQGTLVKTIGDEIMVTFPSAEAAFLAACEMKMAVENDRPSEGIPLHIRIGFNYGDVIKESDDVFGNTVNIAARVTAITRADQIMTTQPVFNALPPQFQNRLRHIMRAEFKGKQEYQEIYTVIFELENTLSTRYGMQAYRKSPDNIDEMTLRYRDQSFKVNKVRRNITLGRGELCNIVVQDDFASRLHMHIELRYGKFIVADQSTNGTYIRFSNGNVMHITGEEITLQGSGSLSLGQSFAENPTEIIEFSVLSNHVQRRQAK